LNSLDVLQKRLPSTFRNDSEKKGLIGLEYIVGVIANESLGKFQKTLF